MTHLKSKTFIISLGARPNEKADHQLTRAEISHFLKCFEEGGKITLDACKNELVGPPLTGIEHVESDWRNK